METRTIIEQFRNVVIQIATPFSTGTGFYLKAHDLIVTNEHVVRGNKRVVIDGATFQRQIVKVLYLDPRHDIAFLKTPKEHSMPSVDLSAGEVLREGDQVITVGHPFGLKYTATQGIISNMLEKQNDIAYIQHDAALNPGNSGGPLIDSEGHVVGINTFIIRDGNNIGFSLPAKYIQNAIESYLPHYPMTAVRCHSCGNLVFDNEGEKGYCPYCGTQIVLPSAVEEYEPLGIRHTIEDLLAKLGYNVELSRKGPNSWEVFKGSARISISYHEQSGLIVGDAFLCALPRKKIKPIYEFLLKENYTIKGLTFSVKGQDVILSLLVYDRYLNDQTGKTLFDHLFATADAYDDRLVDEFGARWREDV